MEGEIGRSNGAMRDADAPDGKGTEHAVCGLAGSQLVTETVTTSLGAVAAREICGGELQVTEGASGRHAGDEIGEANVRRGEGMQQPQGEGANASGVVSTAAVGSVGHGGGGEKPSEDATVVAVLTGTAVTGGVASAEGNLQSLTGKRKRPEEEGAASGGTLQRMEEGGGVDGVGGERRAGEGVAGGAGHLPGPHSSGLSEAERQELATTFTDLASAMDSWDHLWCRRCLVRGCGGEGGRGWGGGGGG